MRETVAAWQEVAKYRAARKILRSAAWGSLFFGVIAVCFAIVRFRPDIWHLGLLFVGAYLLAGFVMTFARPGFAAWVLSGTGFILVGLFNIAITVALAKARSGRPNPFWGILGALQIYLGVKWLGPKSRQAAITLSAPAPQSIKQIDELTSGLRKAKESTGPEYVELVCASPRLMYLRGRLKSDMGFFVDSTGTHVYFALPSDIELTLKKEGPLQPKKNKCELRIRDEKMLCTVTQLSYERLIAWKSRPVGATPDASPTPPASVPEQPRS